MTLCTAHTTDLLVPVNTGTTSWFVGDARKSIDALSNGQPRGY